MKVLVLGAGAIGGYYGSELMAGGANVTFLVREKRQEQLLRDGLVIEVDGQTTRAEVNAVTAISPSDAFDVVLLSCKTYDLESAMQAVAPAAAAGAFLLPLMNGLSSYAALDRRFGVSRVLAGVAYVAVSMNRDGHIRRIGPRDVLYLGSRSSSGVATAASLCQRFSRAGAVRAVPEDIEQELWNKWVMLASGAAMTCLMRGTVGEIMRSPQGELLMKSAIRECASVAQASGYPIGDETMRKVEGLLLDPSSAWAASMMRDIAAGMPRLEGAAVLGDMVDRALAFSLDAPVLSCAFCHTQVYELHRASLGS